MFVSVEGEMIPKRFLFNNSISSASCCVDSFSHMLYLGEECTELSTFNIQRCQSNPEYRIYPCLDVGIEKHSKFCKLANVDCVAQITVSTACDDIKKSPCNIDKYDCKNVSRLKI